LDLPGLGRPGLSPSWFRERRKRPPPKALSRKRLKLQGAVGRGGAKTSTGVSPADSPLVFFVPSVMPAPAAACLPLAARQNFKACHWIGLRRWWLWSAACPGLWHMSGAANRRLSVNPAPSAGGAELQLFELNTKVCRILSDRRTGLGLGELGRGARSRASLRSIVAVRRSHREFDPNDLISRPFRLTLSRRSTRSGESLPSTVPTTGSLLIQRPGSLTWVRWLLDRRRAGGIDPVVHRARPGDRPVFEISRRRAQRCSQLSAGQERNTPVNCLQGILQSLIPLTGSSPATPFSGRWVA